MVWSVSLKNARSVQICLLLEHKSYVDPHVNFQLLEYLSLGYQKQRKEKKTLELMIPVLYYHGTEKWEYKPLAKHFEAYPDFLQKYLPNFEAEFIDLQKLNQAQIENLKNGLLRTALTLQRYYFDKEGLNKQIEQILLNLNPYLESNFIDVIFVYLIQNDRLNKESFKEKLKTLPQSISNKAMSIYDELIQEGIEKGIEKGKAEGISEGAEKELTKNVLNAFDNGFDLTVIRVITGESIERINAILKKNGRIWFK